MPASNRDDLSPARRALLERWSRGESLPTARPIARHDGDGPSPLSFTQRGLWFMDQIHPGTAVNNIALAARLRGPLDADALARALAAVVARHEALRTRVRVLGVEAVQEIDPDATLPLIRRAAADPSLLAVAIRDELATPIASASAPMARATLFRRAADEHVLLIVVHHLVFDGWSRGVLVRDLARAYLSERAGAPADLPATGLRYIDFVAWQRAGLTGPRLARLLAYWRGRLDPPPPPLDLPFDRPRARTLEFAGASLEFSLAPALVAGARELARRLDTTLFAVLLAAYKALLVRVTRSTDITVGSPIAHRTRPELEDMIGALINTLVLRTDLAGEPSFTEVVRRVRTTTLGAHEHQDLPLDLLVEQLRPARDVASPSLFQTMFVLQNTPVEPIAIAGLVIEPMAVEVPATQFDLMLLLEERADGIAGELEYDATQFERGTAEAIVRAYRTILAAALADPETSIAALPLVDADEQAALTRIGPDPDGAALPAGPAGTPDVWLQRLGRERPDAVALIDDGHSVTYGALARVVARGARELSRRGVGPGALVPVIAPRGRLAVVGLMAVLTAGATYVPLDVATPRERLRELLAEIGAALVLSTTPELPGDPTILDLATLGATTGEPLEAPPGRPPDAVAYCIYTSGSTGRPKGVLVGDTSVVHVVRAWEAAYGLSRLDVRLLQLGSFAADVFTGDWLKVLATGGELVVCPDADRLDPRALHALIDRHKITVVESTPGLLLGFTGYLRRRGLGLPSLRLLIFGADYLRAAELRGVHEQLAPRSRVVNGYGLTECTIESAVYEVPLDGGQDPRGGYCALGLPLPGTRLLVLDDRGAVLPVGVLGELHVGGPGVALGYRGDPLRTAERFLEHPRFGRLYRTGDLARWTARGVLEHAGRADDMVKVRGHRVELGDIENVLVATAGVCASAAVAHSHAGETGVTAFLVLEPAAEIDEIAAALRDRLGSMAPARLVALAELPMNANGKIDRARLRAEASRPAAAPTSRAPAADGLAGQVVALWREVLGIDAIGLDDSFLALGGTSLMLMRLFNLIPERFGVEIEMAALFSRHTPRLLAQHIEVVRQDRSQALP